MKVLKILQSFSQGTFIAFILSLLYCGHCSIAEPGYLDFDNLPETNFTCAGKVIGGYYADLEASCQMFHVCTIGQGDEPMDIKFLCLNGTVFDQETRVCERVDEVDCSKSERFYYLNLELYGNTIIPAPEESSSEEVSSSASSPSSTSTSTTSTTTSTTTTTKKPTTTTPSRRFIFNNSKGSPIVSSTTLATPTHGYSTSTSKPGEEEEEYEYEDEEYDDTNSKDDSAATGPAVVPNLEDDGGSFSPQQFTLQQQTQNSQPKPEDPAKTGSKPAVSFQQQHFQNGGTLAVTNSHVTVTTHTTSSSGTGGSSSSNSNTSNNANSQKKNAQPSLTTKEKHALEHQKLQQQQALLQQQMLAKQHQELQKKQQEAAVQQQQKAIQQQQKQVQQHESEIKNHQAQLLLHTQKINRQQQQKPFPNKSTYNPYGVITPHQQQQEQQSEEQTLQAQSPKRIPLLAAVNPIGPPQQSPVASQPSSVSQLAPFRLRAQGFKLPSQQEDRFEGYRRQPPPQVSLHLPFEQLRHQKDISLQFDPEEEDLTQIPNRKELKRSDPPFHSSIHGNNTPPTVSLKTSVTAANNAVQSTAQAPVAMEHKQPEPDSASYPDDPVEYYDEDYSAEPASGNPSLDSVKSNSNSGSVVTHKRSGENQLGDPKVLTGSGLPTTQASRTSSSSGNNSSKSKNTSRFIINNEHHKSPTNPYNSNRARTGRLYDGRPSGLGGTPTPKSRASYNPQPKVIVTTSTSIRDNSGRTINYSISSSNPSPATTAASHVAKYREPSTRGYDEYKEDDVLSDPFFLDVPKVSGGNGRRKRDAWSQRKRRKPFLYIVPRFM